MVERRIELDRRNQRKMKMRKLKAKLGTTTGEDREKILSKIKRISPWWTEASLTNTPQAASTAPKAPRAPKAPSSDPKKKAPPAKPKKDKP